MIIFSRGDYQQLVFSALNFKNKPIKLVKPCVVKPQLLWSGKQVHTYTITHSNLNLQSMICVPCIEKLLCFKK